MLVAATLFVGACSNTPASERTSRVRPVESPTPEYKPPKRVSRDIISNDPKDERKSIAKKTK